jgi:hypothetical protein
MLYVECPHCQYIILIEDINCRIFRHAVYKDTFEPVNPHASEEECNRLLSEHKVIGCCKPFKLNEQNIPEICNYE